ncbi:MAG: phage/plasmid primase, P4 family [Deltaproteobacteria bacterium]|nr:phage/plasmid primase, P4 family [Deltaproteobacteria bacterium]
MLTQAENLVNTPLSLADIQSLARDQMEQERADFAALSFTDAELLEGVKGGEVGDSNLYTRLNLEKRVCDHAAGKWYEFSGHSWKEDETDNALASLDELVDLYAGLARKIYSQMMEATRGGDKEGAQGLEAIESMIRKKIGLLQRRRHRENVLVLAAAGPASLGITGREWDKDPYLLPFQNGVLDLRTRTFRPGRPDDYIKTVCPIAWQGFDAPAPRWKKFVPEILEHDTELVSYFQRLLGYSFAGLTTEHVIIILWGLYGRNGKGTLIEIIYYILDQLAGPIQSELLLNQDRIRSSAAASPDIMGLQGKRVVCASETDKGRKLDAGKVKWLVGGDTLIGRNPYGKREIRFRPSHTLFLLTNYKPKVDPTDYAIWERIHLIPFNLSYVDHPIKPHERKRDENLLEKLKNEAPGIVSWIVAGFYEWQRIGLRPPAKVLNATQAYQKSEDTLEQFIFESCVIAAESWARAKDLWENYVAWCDENGHKPIWKNTFGERLQARFIKERKENGNIYEGIGLIVAK